MRLSGSRKRACCQVLIDQVAVCVQIVFMPDSGSLLLIKSYSEDASASEEREPEHFSTVSLKGRDHFKELNMIYQYSI